MAFHPGVVPKQAKALLEGQNKVLTYESSGGKVTSQFAADNLKLLPAIPSGSTIHDNAAGAGTVTRLILASNAPSDIKIHATDIDQPFLDALQSHVDATAWPVDVSNQKSEALSFPDDYFSHSFTNIGIFFTSTGGLDGATEVYRTLRPGGTAVVNCWGHITWMLPMKAVHDAFRPGRPFPAPPINWSDGKRIQQIMVDAGFAREGLRVESSNTWAKTADLRDFAEKMWAYLGGIGVWQESDEENWDKAVDLLVELLLKQEGTKEVGGEVWMRASQWVVIATK